MRVSQDDRTRVEQAVREAEARAGADFVCVLLRRSSGYEFYPLAWASVIALTVPWLLLWATRWPVAEILLAQMAVFGLALVGLGWGPARRLLVPRQLQRATAHRAAAEQFLIRDLASRPDRRSVLLFVSSEERYARVLADDGALMDIPESYWRGAVDKLVAEARQGRPAAGFVAALAHCAEALGHTAPADRPRRDALPNRFVVED